MRRFFQSDVWRMCFISSSCPGSGQSSGCVLFDKWVLCYSDHGPSCMWSIIGSYCSDPYDFQSLFISRIQAAVCVAPSWGKSHKAATNSMHRKLSGSFFFFFFFLVFFPLTHLIVSWDWSQFYGELINSALWYTARSQSTVCRERLIKGFARSSCDV